ncbi:hypothetical protein CW731_01050 [Polaribacter sp. ALD11]|uniref:hypothetical protein n=1 Tax=Polaribacter sp. ALD11 TaxID=2058137 RepID=UPI000C31888C|nr:hypothetical protein [Polaribacter sp. ALD11]AUC83962.1 hypothetical protein CW731_01050 [Polaribacter sp. ALD11]
MNKKYFYLFFFGFFFLPSIKALNMEVTPNYSSFIEYNYQDNRILIKKIKAKLNALEKKRERLMVLKKWSDSNENNYLLKINKLRDSLEELGESSTKKLDADEVIKKLQKQLKFLNNARVNKNAKEIWTIKDDSIYEKKASILIDSIIKLRIKKE